jgi:hypothetical protein
MQKISAGKFHGVPPGDTKAILISMRPKGSQDSGWHYPEPLASENQFRLLTCG